MPGAVPIASSRSAISSVATAAPARMYVSTASAIPGTSAGYMFGISRGPVVDTIIRPGSGGANASVSLRSGGLASPDA